MSTLMSVRNGKIEFNRSLIKQVQLHNETCACNHHLSAYGVMDDVKSDLVINTEEYPSVILSVIYPNKKEF